VVDDPMRADVQMLPGLPVPGGVPNPYAAHVHRLEQGFEEAYRAMMKPVQASRLAERMRVLVGVPRRYATPVPATFGRGPAHAGTCQMGLGTQNWCRCFPLTHAHRADATRTISAESERKSGGAV
jgi:hypothetical protein